MPKRRYAILAMGHIGDKEALPVLQTIVEDETETDYFRADALSSIWLIDQSAAERYVERYVGVSDSLGRLCERLLSKNTPWLRRRTFSEASCSMPYQFDTPQQAGSR